MEISGQGMPGQVQSTNRYIENSEVMAGKQNAAAEGKSQLLNSLEPGSYLYGQVQSSSEDGAVLLLENGQKLLAKLTEGVTLTPGQNVTFQVERNQDGIVYMKPLFAEAALEMTAGKALKQAGFMNTPKNLEIVKELLELNMPVDKNTIRSMLQKSVTNPEMPIKQLALFEKLGIPVTRENIEQLKQYQASEHQIGKQMDSLMKELGEATRQLLAEGKTTEATELNQKVLDFLYEELTEQNQEAEGTGEKLPNAEAVKGDSSTEASIGEQIPSEGKNLAGEQILGEGKNLAGEQLTGEGKNLTGEQIPDEGKNLTGEQLSNEGKNLTGEQLSNEGKNLTGEQSSNVGKNLTGEQSSNVGKNLTEEQIPGEGKSLAGGQPLGEERNFTGELLLSEKPLSEEKSPVGELLSEGKGLVGESSLVETVSGERAVIETEGNQSESRRVIESPESPELSKMSLETERLAGSPEKTFPEMRDNGTAYIKEQMFELKNLLAQTTNPEELKKLLSSTKFQNILERGMKEAWQIKPEEFTGKDSISRSYSKVEEQTRLLGELLRESGTENGSSLKTITNVQQNLEFMQDLNQVFPYIQLPLQMAGESAHGDLYVFQDKKKKHETGDPFTAFLHLNMEHLGDVDVYLSLKEQSVSTDITLEKEEVLDLFETHMDELIGRLEKKGYQVNTSLKISEKKPDFIEDILSRQAGGSTVNRYSFDVKA